jgi:hypothetical protein
MRVGETGHQDRPNIRWDWVKGKLDAWLDKCRVPLEGWSCLAAGADQLFAERIIAHGHNHTAVVPFEGYEQVFASIEARSKYDVLLSKSRVVQLKLNGLPHQEAFLRAGHHVVNSVERMIFIWDGAEAVGRGGTGDIVSYARARKKIVAILNPIRCVKEGDWS